ncbi:MAG: NAD(P)H-dependent oxidoreductase [Gammaproteobacteria bacterium]|nr:NAD(P)H-dependent oxidoreductase [Gammaproteobacteria bacterium]
MTVIVGIAGSLRKASFNAALLRVAGERMPAGSELHIASIDGVPLYDADVEAESGVPAAVARLKDAVAGAQGLLIATPEYNNSLPGVLKNAIDWMSRPSRDQARVFQGKPVAIMGATPGGMGTALAQAAWLPVMRSLGLRWYTGGLLYVSRAASVFGPDGGLADPALGERIDKYLAGFLEFVNGRA